MVQKGEFDGQVGRVSAVFAERVSDRWGNYGECSVTPGSVLGFWGWREEVGKI